jgi:hypothetical protein
VGQRIFGFEFDFARNPIFLWIFYFEIHTHPIIQLNPLFWVGFGGFDWVD